MSWFLVLLAGIAWAAQEQSDARQQSNLLVHLEIRDAIGPATSDFLLRALEHAKERDAQLLVLELDTPGGLDTAMRDMIQAILASPVPVVTYVAPSGARAASAGTYILYASHIAAMAPATSVGAATPVQIGGGNPRQPDQDKGRAPEREGTQDNDNGGKNNDAAKDKAGARDQADARDKDVERDATDKPPGGRAPEPGSALERKAVNDAVSYIRGLAELRDRNADWAEQAVRAAVSLTASAALEQNVVDVVAADLPDLLRQIDGRSVRAQHRTVQIETEGIVIEEFTPDWRTRLLSVLTNPNVAYLLMLAGIYGLLLEGYNPGAILPGVVGAVSLLLALYAFQVLSVNYAGVALLVLGVALIVAEAFSPSLGVLGIGGVIAFVIGSILLFDEGVPGFEIARGLIGGIALGAGLLMLLMVSVFMRARKRQVETGVEQLLHGTAIALNDFETSGLVDIHGETWRAVTRTSIKKGQRLRVLRVDGLTLEVAPEN